jgi:hypothetical protein
MIALLFDEVGTGLLLGLYLKNEIPPPLVRNNAMQRQWSLRDIDSLLLVGIQLSRMSSNLVVVT